MRGAPSPQRERTAWRKSAIAAATRVPQRKKMNARKVRG
jgi:hypothetical protein